MDNSRHTLDTLSGAFGKINKKPHKKAGKRPAYNSAYHDRYKSSEAYSLSEHVLQLEQRVQQLEKDNKLLLKAVGKLFSS